MKFKKFFYISAAAIAACAVVSSTAGCSGTQKAPTNYKPLAPEGTLIAYVAEMEGLSANPMLKFLMDYSTSTSTLLNGKLVELGLIPANNSNIDFAALNAQKLKQLDDFKWFALTMARPSFTAEDLDKLDDDDAPIPCPAMAAVYAMAKPMTIEALEACIKSDFDNFVTSLNTDEQEKVCDFIKDNIEVANDTVAGVSIKKFTLKQNEDTCEISKFVKDLEPCYGAFDDSLFIFASSPAVFADTVALYSGKGKVATDQAIAEDFATGNAAYARAGIYGVNSAIRDFAGDDIFDEMGEEASKYLAALENLRLKSSLDGAGMSASETITATFTDESLAQTLQPLVESGKGMINMFAMMASAQTPAISPLLEIVNSAATRAEGKTFSLTLTMTKADIESLDLPALASQIAAIRGINNSDDDDDGEED